MCHQKNYMKKQVIYGEELINYYGYYINNFGQLRIIKDPIWDIISKKYTFYNGNNYNL